MSRVVSNLIASYAVVVGVYRAVSDVMVITRNIGESK